MPKSKRNKQVELAKTKKKGLAWKKGLFEEVRSCVDKYANAFIFSVSDMRNSKMKNVREQWKHSRFFIGKNKIMAMALGRSAEEEYKPNLHKLGQQIKGERGLLFSNKPVGEVLSWFRSYSEGDYARSGNVATETVNLPAGPLTMFPHNQEPYLRQLGLPTTLVKGVIHLVKDHEVCKEGDVLSPETAKILKLLDYEMAEFHITIHCVWSQDGAFMQLTESVDTDTKEKLKKGKTLGTKTMSNVSKSVESVDVEEMEVECNENGEAELEDSEEAELKDNEEAELEDNKEAELKDKENAELNDRDEAKLNDDEVELVELDEEDSANSEDENNNSMNISSSNLLRKKGSNVSKASNKTDLKDSDESFVIDKTASTNDNDMFVMESTPLKSSEDNTDKMSDNINESSDRKEDTAPSTQRGRPSTRKSVKVKPKKVSLPKTPDANTSQDSPVFRQLRTRSVQFSSKKRRK